MLIVSDIDGTLLPYGATELDAGLFPLIARLRRQGVLFCPASGRQFHSLRQLFAPVAEELGFLCENGAIIYGPGAEEDAPVLSKITMPREDALALTARLAELGAEALSETVTALAVGTAVRIPQDHSRMTYASMLTKEMSPVDWTRSAHAVSCQIRGLIPWPCASTTAISGEPMKLYAAEETGEDASAAPGTILAAGKAGIDIACGDGKVLRITELQAQGGKRMSAAAYLLGHPIQVKE